MIGAFLIDLDELSPAEKMLGDALLEGRAAEDEKVVAAMKPRLDRAVAAASEKLGEDAAAWNAGKAMSLDRAINYALEETEQCPAPG